MKLIDVVYQTIVPLKDDISFISSHFNKNIESLFEFLRFLLGFSILMFITYIYLMVSHAYHYFKGNGTLLCKFYFPCFLYYSSFDSTEKEVFSYTLSFGAFVIFFGTVKKIYSQHKKGTIQKILDSGNLSVSQMFFNIWDWNIRDEPTLNSSKGRINDAIVIGLYEEEINDRIKNRVEKEEHNLIFRRVFSIFLSLVILIISGGCIAGGYILGNLSILNTVVNY